MITTQGLIDKCTRWMFYNYRTDQEALIKDAILTALREINTLSHEPMAWNREQYDEMFTRYYGVISNITSADPGVITADSVDPDLDADHGFQTNDIVYLDGVNGENSRHRLNNRFFRSVRIGATSLSLKTLDGQTAIDTTDYEDYDAGGYIYHAGIVFPSIEPTGGTASYEWKIRRIFGVDFDNNPSLPVNAETAKRNRLMNAGGLPRWFRYEKYSYDLFGPTNVDHLLFWYPFPSQRYNVCSHIEKIYPDITVWDDDVYPPLPEELHDYIWHRALSLLSTYREQKDDTNSKPGENYGTPKIEVINSLQWVRTARLDEDKIMDFHNKILGNQSSLGDGMSA
jgi:hypothetical protein